MFYMVRVGLVLVGNLRLPFSVENVAAAGAGRHFRFSSGTFVKSKLERDTNAV